MSTIHSLQMLAVDLEQRVVREMQLQGDAERQVVDALATVREAFNHLENVILAAFQERSRALAAALGNGKPSPDTYEGVAVGPVAPPPPRLRPKRMTDAPDADPREDKAPRGAVGAE